jgi:hypothetical protein
MAEWLVTLSGDSFDLDFLPRLLQSPGCTVGKEGDTYYLRSQEFSTLEDAGDVKRRADELLRTLKGAAAAALHEDIESVSVHGISREEDSGGPRTQFIFPGPVVFRGRARVIANLTNATGPTDATGPSVLDWWMEVGTRDSPVAEALACFASGESDAVNLWKVYEIIREDVGGKERVVSSGWATGDEIDVFRHTVNCPAALGRRARHAARKCSESEHMSLKEAYSLVGKVLRAWVGARVASLPPGSRADGAS